jgi:hypothetical protein
MRVRRAIIALLIAASVVPSTGCSATSAGAADRMTPTPSVTVASDDAHGAEEFGVARALTPAGTPVTIGRFQYTLGPVEWDQTDRVVDANVVPPGVPGGYGWALIRLTVKNLRHEAATPGRFTVVLHAGGWDVSHLEVLTHTVPMPDAFRARALDQGDQVAGNLGFWIPDAAGTDPECTVELLAKDQPASSITFSCETPG